jgi:hypothetical protein
MSSDRHSYFAGLFDGEGSFSIQVQKRYYKGVPSLLFSVRMTMTLKYGAHVLDEMVSLYGGTVYKYDDGMSRWSLGTRGGVRYATKMLLPHLVIKKAIAENFLSALDLYKSPSGVNKHGGERMWDKERATKMVNIAHTLNPYSKTKNKGAQLEALQEIYG